MGRLPRLREMPMLLLTKIARGNTARVFNFDVARLTVPR
jgi:hypothetical protein